jgi:hypothetical protein
MHVDYEKNIEAEPRLVNTEVRRIDGRAIHSLGELQLDDELIVPTLVGYVIAKVYRDEESLVADTDHSIYDLVLDEETSRVITTYGCNKSVLEKIPLYP